MKVLIDTSSLLSLVRYYLPFDGRKKMHDFFKDKMSAKEIVLIDRVFEECRYTAGGTVLSSVSCLGDSAFLKDCKLPFSTKHIVAPDTKQFLHHVNNTFVNAPVRRKLSDDQFETEKLGFLAGADMGLVMMCMEYRNQNKGETVLLVTEETEGSNDRKVFKKLPAICQVLNLETITLPTLLQRYPDIDVQYT
ncbi:MAG: DUF4411 family protein [Ignavibacteria bacterium]|nr:DUF4411 family protein [Ignavibacteria bacterium]